jgi:exodeoxyribonuclease VII small subunit
MQDDRAQKEPTFEAAYARLKKAVEELEAGPLPLDVAIARYEEGMRLAKLCDSILDQAEVRIRHVLREGDDQPGKA